MVQLTEVRIGQIEKIEHWCTGSLVAGSYSPVWYAQTHSNNVVVIMALLQDHCVAAGYGYGIYDGSIAKYIHCNNN